VVSNQFEVEPPNLEEIEVVLRSLDENKDGKLQFNEIKELL